MQVRDIAAYLLGKHGARGTATAAGAGDATEVDGGYQSIKGYMSAEIMISFEAVLAQDETISFSANFQDALDSSGTGVADYGDATDEALSAAVAATGDTGGSTEVGVISFPVDLQTAREYGRVQVTPDLSASGTDTVDWHAVIVLSGGHTLPI